MPKLVNLGSLCIDFVYSVPALVNAGETVASTERQVFSGGKGLNQSVAAARAGASVHHFGAVGEDGDMLIEQLRAEQVDVSGVLSLDGPSGHAVIQVDSAGQNAIVISGGSNRQIPDSLIDQAVSSLQPGDWLLLQNEINDVGGIMQQAADAGAQIAFNVAPPDERIHTYPIDTLALLIVNGHEAMALARQDSTAAAYAALTETYPRTDLVLTQGHHGLLCYDASSQTHLQMNAFAVEPVDETAAGDAFVGYLMAGLVAGEGIADALPSASAAGALAVTAEGAAPSVPSQDAVKALLAAQTLTPSVRQNLNP